MVKEPVFRGAATALITPLNKNGVDFRSLGKLIDWQIEQGIDALVIVGTTGEKSTLTSLEHLEVVRYAIERADHRVPIIVGTGSNDTAHAINMSREAVSMGADALLCVTPYYNKATQNGLVTMYETIADSVDKPIILYNVPSRTGVGIEPETYAKLADHPNIAGIKEANGDISKIVETMARVRGRLDLYSGNDDQIVPLMALGGKGVISVLSNVLPRETVELCDRFFRGDIAGAAEMQCRYHRLIDALFSEVNPIPVKAAMAAMGYCEDYLRLPLTSMEDDTRANLLDAMREVGINV